MKPDNRLPEYRNLSPRQHLRVTLAHLYYRFRYRIYAAIAAITLGLILELMTKK